ncbi:AtpZ/AtpI family protein [Sphingomonas sp.]|uniref:AtpZ/AtpI family protein n=1 Tax=Sphingomonas sp. TaxID=28214 RepID=UPI003B00331E
MAENESGPDPLGDDPRLTSLDARLKQAQAAEAHRTGAGKTDATESYNLGNRVLAELLGGMIGGALIGWVLDRLFGTSPALLLLLLFLGIGVAFRNIIRLSKRSK